MASRLMKKDISNLEKLNKEVFTLWYEDAILKDQCKKLIDSMPKRIQQVIENNGGHTKY